MTDTTPVTLPATEPGDAPVAGPGPTPVAVPPPQLSELDYAKLQSAKKDVKLAQQDAQLAQHNFRAFVQDLFARYGLTNEDVVDEGGQILRGVAKK